MAAENPHAAVEAVIAEALMPGRSLRTAAILAEKVRAKLAAAVASGRLSAEQVGAVAGIRAAVEYGTKAGGDRAVLVPTGGSDGNG